MVVMCSSKKVKFGEPRKIESVKYEIPNYKTIVIEKYKI